MRHAIAVTVVAAVLLAGLATGLVLYAGMRVVVAAGRVLDRG